MILRNTKEKKKEIHRVVLFLIKEERKKNIFFEPENLHVNGNEPYDNKHLQSNELVLIASIQANNSARNEINKLFVRTTINNGTGLD